MSQEQGEMDLVDEQDQSDESKLMAVQSMANYRPSIRASTSNRGGGIIRCRLPLSVLQELKHTTPPDTL